MNTNGNNNVYDSWTIKNDKIAIKASTHILRIGICVGG